MEPTVRKQITLTRDQARALADRARRERLSEAELLRLAVERLLEADPPASALGAPNKRADDLLRYIDEIATAHPTEPRDPGEGRGWTRDELYDERLSRWLP